MAKETLKDAKVAEATTESKVEVMQVQAPRKEQKAVKESVYTVGELAANARKTFKTRQECVAAALKAAGKPEYTVSEAKEIVEKFLKRRVE